MIKLNSVQWFERYPQTLPSIIIMEPVNVLIVFSHSICYQGINLILTWTCLWKFKSNSSFWFYWWRYHRWSRKVYKKLFGQSCQACERTICKTHLGPSSIMVNEFDLLLESRISLAASVFFFRSIHSCAIARWRFPAFNIW